ncbi:MAG: FG-GAP-like repeat-containing protein, partial [bacterium]|nr:FG-GAP-like repeat-containing protein [bacterium]
VLINNGNGTFATKVDYETGVSSYSVTMGDVNGDGKNDLAVTNGDNKTVSVLINNGNGTFATKVDYGTGTFPMSVAIGDVNGDGKNDLAVANNNPSNVAVLINNGNGTFATKVDYGTGERSISVAIGDVNGDGKNDLAVANNLSGNVSVLINNGINSAKTVTANFTLLTYALTVAKSGTGSGTVASAPTGISCGTDCSESYDYGKSVTLTATPATGSEFTGWSDVACPGTGVCMVTINSAKTITANFKLLTYDFKVERAIYYDSGSTPVDAGSITVTNTNKEINCGSNCSKNYDYGTSVTLTANTVSPFVFTGWSGNCVVGVPANVCVATIDSAKTVIANFTLPAYVLTVARAGTGKDSGTVISIDTKINCGTSCQGIYNNNTSITLTANVLAGSKFAGWSGGGCSGIGDCEVTIDSAKTVTANFELLTLTVQRIGTGRNSGTITSVSAGISCGTDCSETYNYNAPITLTANVLAGSRFVGWSGGGCSGAGACDVTMDSAKTVSANFELLKLTVEIDRTGTGSGIITSAPAGISCGTDCSEVYNNNTSVVLTATPLAGSKFVGWDTGFGDCKSSGVGTCTVIMDKERDAVAKFELLTLTVIKTGTTEIYGVGPTIIDSKIGTVASAPAGITKINCDINSVNCSEVYNYGTSVVLTATATNGGKFTGWSGSGCSGTGTCIVTMDSSKTVTANFDSCGGTVKDSGSTQLYKTVKIGNQCWMAENLNTGTMITADRNQSKEVVNKIEKYCFGYKNSNSDSISGETNCTNYGGLYQWNEAMNYSTAQGVQGICPTGWHIPTVAEWGVMEMALGMTSYDANSLASAWRGAAQAVGDKMKKTGLCGGRNPSLCGTSGFDAVMSGKGRFAHSTLVWYGWSSTSLSINVYIRALTTSTSQSLLAGVYHSLEAKTNAYSIRCLKN